MCVCVCDFVYGYFIRIFVCFLLNNCIFIDCVSTCVCVCVCQFVCVRKQQTKQTQTTASLTPEHVTVKNDCHRDEHYLTSLGSELK